MKNYHGMVGTNHKVLVGRLNKITKRLNVGVVKKCKSGD